MTWLQGSQEEWLILLDNADTRGMDLRPHLPKCGHGNILITSRNPDLWVHTGSHKRAIQISDLSDDDAAMLLLNTAGVVQTADNKKHAAAIAKELYCFPLAIVQAGAFISKSPHLKDNMPEYIQLYRDKTAELLSEKAIQSTDDYRESVYTTWRLSFSQLAQAEPLAVQFLQLCSFIHCEGITEEIFERASKYKHRGSPLGPTQKALKPSLEFLSRFQNSETSSQKPGLKFLSRFRKRDTVWDKIVFQKMISEICGYSLMAWQNNAYSIHPLVHQWSRTTMKDLVGQRRLMINLLGMATACSDGVVKKLQLLLHLVQLSKDADLVNTGFEVHFVHVFWTGGIFERAENLQAQVLARSRTVLGDKHSNTVYAMANLATTYHSLGQYTDALKLKEQVLEKWTKLLSAEHPDTLRAMADLAITYHSLGQYTNALKLKEQVLEKRTKLLSAEHPDTLRAMADLAITYHSLGQYTNASVKLNRPGTSGARRSRACQTARICSGYIMRSLGPVYGRQCTTRQCTTVHKYATIHSNTHTLRHPIPSTLLDNITIGVPEDRPTRPAGDAAQPRMSSTCRRAAQRERVDGRSRDSSVLLDSLLALALESDDKGGLREHDLLEILRILLILRASMACSALLILALRNCGLLLA
ncbi:hypothetical protein C8F01DRAFT_1230785 [Mycena amicta]|nr:hypothetical protein C8F01DRAFT_1230785 [Mycena amicta]